MGDTINKKATDRYLISTGGLDKCVFQWRNEEGSEVRDISAHPATDREGDEGGKLEGQEDFLMEGPSGGDEFTATKPWLGAIVAPSAWGAAEENVGGKKSLSTSIVLSASDKVYIDVFYIYIYMYIYICKYIYICIYIYIYIQAQRSASYSSALHDLSVRYVNI
jgi:hypothetical protein